MLHLAVSVFVFSDGDLLLQRRAAGKYHCAGLWANTCCSHPYWNEPVTISAERRLREELGLDVALTAAALIDYSTPVTDGLWENERVQVFYAHVDHKTIRLDPDPTEVAEVCWKSPAAIEVELATNPEAYAPWFRIYMARWSELGIPWPASGETGPHRP